MKKACMALAGVLVCVLFLSGCDKYMEYEGSGYYTASDGSFQVAYQPGFEQKEDVGDAIVYLDRKDAKLTFEVARIAKDSDPITNHQIANIDDFAKVYEEESLGDFKEFMEFGELTSPQGFDNFINTRLYYQTSVTKQYDGAGFIVYGETEDNYYFVYATGTEESFEEYQETMMDMAKSIAEQ